MVTFARFRSDQSLATKNIVDMRVWVYMALQLTTKFSPFDAYDPWAETSCRAPGWLVMPVIFEPQKTCVERPQPPGPRTSFQRLQQRRFCSSPSGNCDQLLRRCRRRHPTSVHRRALALVARQFATLLERCPWTSTQVSLIDLTRQSMPLLHSPS